MWHPPLFPTTPFCPESGLNFATTRFPEGGGIGVRASRLVLGCQEVRDYQLVVRLMIAPSSMVRFLIVLFLMINYH